MRGILLLVDLFLCLGALSVLLYLWSVVGDTSEPLTRSKGAFLSGRDILFKVTKMKKNTPLYEGFDESKFLAGAKNVFMMMLAHVKGEATDVMNYVTLPLSLHQIPVGCVEGLQLRSVTSVEQVMEGDTARIHVQFMFHVPPSAPKGEVWIFERPITLEESHWRVVGLTSLAGFPKVHPFI